MDRDEVEVYENAKKGRGQYQAILTEQAWSTNTSEWNDKCTKPLKANSKSFLNLKNVSKWLKGQLSATMVHCKFVRD